MADSLIGSLRVALSLGTAEFEAGANKAAAIARSKSKQIESSFSGAKAAVAGLFAAFTVGLLTEQIKKSLDYAGSLAEVSRTLGVTTKDLQTFRFAATQSGVAQDQLEVGLRRLTVSMGKAELGSKEQAKAFGAIGISLDQLKGKNTGEVFRLMADGLSKVTDRSQRAAIEMTLMGRSGSTLDNLLAPGARRLNELADAAQRMGIVLSDSQIQGAEETAHKLEAVKQVLAAQIAGVVASNAQAIYSLSSALATLTGQILKFLSSNPQLALGIVGALLGGRLGGLPGAALGGAAGALLGGKVAQSEADSNTDLAFRSQKLREALGRYRNSQGAPDRAVLPGIGVDVGSAAAKKEVIRQTELLRQATAQHAAARTAVNQAGRDLPQIFAPDGSKKKTPRDKNEADEFEIAQQQRQLDLEILQAKRDLSHDYVEQTTLSIQMLGIEKAIKDAEIDHKVAQAKRDFAEGKITAATLDEIVAQAAITKQKEATVDRLKRQAVLEAEQEQRFKDVQRLDNVNFDLQREKLQSEAELAQTASERRDVELRLLALAFQQEKARLEAVEADKQSTDADKEEARRRLAALGGQYAAGRANVIQQTRGPLEQYLAGLPTTAKKWTEALQGVAVDGFGVIESAADKLAGKIVKVGGIFGDVTRTIIADLLKIELQKMIIAPLANALGGLLGGGSGLGQSIFPVVGGVDPLAPLPGFAAGGSFAIGGNMGTDRNVAVA
jgi:hypothetical protein